MTHHRDHALGHINSASNHLEFTQVKYARFLSSTTITNPPDVSHQEFLQRVVAVFDDLVEVSIMLGDPSSNLDKARRKLTRANIAGSQATINHLKYATNWLATVAEVEVGGNRAELGGAMRDLSQCWEFVDMAIWHVNDGIREEVYNDPAFSEASPP